MAKRAGRNGALRTTERVAIRRLRAAGLLWSEIEAQLGVSQRSIARVVSEAGGMAPREKDPSPYRLAYGDRVAIEVCVGLGRSFAEIGWALERHPSTVSREVNRNGGRDHYRAWRAQHQADAHAKRPKVSKLAACPRLAAAVTTGLTKKWSPSQVSQRLTADHPDDPEMRVSPETIYQELFVQTRGGLNKELVKHLRSGRTARKPQSRAGQARPGGGVIKDRVMLSERPPDAADRAVPGHWEGDLIKGTTASNSAIATLVERTTRSTVLVHLGTNHTAANVAQRLQEEIRRLPDHLWKSLTWDQGVEMAHHAQFTIDSGIQVYFCPPHTPWLRGTNENTNGLLRQYFPKGTDLSVHTQADLDAVAHELNDRPRQTLNWMKPSEQLHALMR